MRQLTNLPSSCFPHQRRSRIIPCARVLPRSTKQTCASFANPVSRCVQVSSSRGSGHGEAWPWTPRGWSRLSFSWMTRLGREIDNDLAVCYAFDRHNRRDGKPASGASRAVSAGTGKEYTTPTSNAHLIPSPPKGPTLHTQTLQILQSRHRMSTRRSRDLVPPIPPPKSTLHTLGTYHGKPRAARMKTAPQHRSGKKHPSIALFLSPLQNIQLADSPARPPPSSSLLKSPPYSPTASAPPTASAQQAVSSPHTPLHRPYSGYPRPCTRTGAHPSSAPARCQPPSLPYRCSC